MAVFPGAPKQDEPAECDEGELQISREHEHPPQGHRQDAHRLADGPPPEMKYSPPVIVVVAEDVLGQLKHTTLRKANLLSNKFNTPHQFLFASQTLLTLKAS